MGKDYIKLRILKGRALGFFDDSQTIRLVFPKESFLDIDFQDTEK